MHRQGAASQRHCICVMGGTLGMATIGISIAIKEPGESLETEEQHRSVVAEDRWNVGR